MSVLQVIHSVASLLGTPVESTASQCNSFARELFPLFITEVIVKCGSSTFIEVVLII